VEGGTHLYRGPKNRGSPAVSPFLAQKNLVLILLTHRLHFAFCPSILCSPPRTCKISMARSAPEHPSYYYVATRSGSSSSAVDSRCGRALPPPHGGWRGGRVVPPLQPMPPPPYHRAGCVAARLHRGLGPVIAPPSLSTTPPATGAIGRGTMPEHG
jgi:hypothetical protein